MKQETPEAEGLEADEVELMEDTETYPVPIRRHKQNHRWLQPDQGRLWFIGDGFKAGLLIDVQFIHNAKPMECVAGYDSTGEAIGMRLEEFETDPDMPSDVVRQATVVYNPERRVFHDKLTPEVPVETADYLLLCTDGKAIAGWKQ